MILHGRRNIPQQRLLRIGVELRQLAINRLDPTLLCISRLEGGLIFRLQVPINQHRLLDIRQPALLFLHHLRFSIHKDLLDPFGVSLADSFKQSLQIRDNPREVVRQPFLKPPHLHVGLLEVVEQVPHLTVRIDQLRLALQGRRDRGPVAGEESLLQLLLGGGWKFPNPLQERRDLIQRLVRHVQHCAFVVAGTELQRVRHLAQAG
ncbi:MAG: hypothetical protein JW395_2279 [Nitrospira sp.]|nr:hypothetical protein [Nitrospira sp.]